VKRPDGTLLFGGAWADTNGVNHLGLLRLTSEGVLEDFVEWSSSIDAHPLALQTDGRILVSGYGVGVIRLQTDGRPDTSFHMQTGTYRSVNAILAQPDGQIVVGGRFASVNGQPMWNLVRLNGGPMFLDTPFVERHVQNQGRVELKTTPKSSIGGYLVQDRTGEAVVQNISHNGQFDPLSGTITFGPFADDQPRVLSYSVSYPTGTAGQFQFTGEAIADGVSSPIVGDQTLRIWPFPPPSLWAEIRRRPISGHALLQVFGDRDGAIEIEASSDLSQWNSVGWSTNAQGWSEWIIPDIPLTPQCFYRLKLAE
jgi:hypothetical protein